MIGGKLTIEQKDILYNQKYLDSTYFNPVQDINGDWFIFDEEMKCVIPEFAFVQNLPLFEYVPKPPKK